ncbi:hypothetical protein SGLAM104S_03745 [Streptomyces glaucescens]
MAYIRSTIPACTSVMEPIRVITWLSSTTLRYAGFSLTRRSIWGRSSSRAVARRIAPWRCTVPASSTYPRGSSNSNSVRSPWSCSSGGGAAAGGAAACSVAGAGAVTWRISSRLPAVTVRRLIRR